MDKKSAKKSRMFFFFFQEIHPDSNFSLPEYHIFDLLIFICKSLMYYVSYILDYLGLPFRFIIHSCNVHVFLL